MKLIKNIIARFLAVWALITFILTFFVIFIPSMLSYLLPEPKGQAMFIWVSKLWMNIWLPLVGCPVKVRGKENYKNGETYIVTCNHNSMMDIPLSCPFIPGANKTIAKSSFAKVPLFGFFYMKGAVLVNRKSDLSRKRSYDKMKAVLAKGMHMSIYPEGTRNRTSEPLKKFHDGAFRLAVDTGKSIIPAVLFNTKKVLPANKTFWFQPMKIEMHFLPAISPAGKTADQLKEEVFEIMSTYYSRNSK
jgi:1-acyl-sn-glycerol-3-phosphate acyltransferase